MKNQRKSKEKMADKTDDQKNEAVGADGTVEKGEDFLADNFQGADDRCACDDNQCDRDDDAQCDSGEDWCDDGDDADVPSGYHDGGDT